MHLSISYNLTGRGWADCMISLNGENTFLIASYVEDALGNLAEATLKIVQGKKTAYAVFAEEPGEYRWKISKINEREILVEIICFEEWKGLEQTDDEGEIILHFRCELIFFVRKIITCLDEVLEEHGLDGYKEKWKMHEFPLKTYNKLRKKLPKLKQK